METRHLRSISLIAQLFPVGSHFSYRFISRPPHNIKNTIKWSEVKRVKSEVNTLNNRQWPRSNTVSAFFFFLFDYLLWPPDLLLTFLLFVPALFFSNSFIWRRSLDHKAFFVRFFYSIPFVRDMCGCWNTRLSVKLAPVIPSQKSLFFNLCSFYYKTNEIFNFF